MFALLLMLLAPGDVSGELFTALVDLEKLLHAERQVAMQLRQFVEQQTQHLRQLSEYVPSCTTTIAQSEVMPVHAARPLLHCYQHCSQRVIALQRNCFYPRDVYVSAVFAATTWLTGWVSVTRRYCV